MSNFDLIEKSKKDPKHCPYCGHSDEKDVLKKESTQERIRLLRRVALKLLGGDKKKLAEELDEVSN